jgi:hypothetical protein
VAEKKRKGLLFDEVLPRVRGTVQNLLSLDPQSIRNIIGEREKIRDEIKKTQWFKEFVEQYGEEPDLSENADYDYFTAWKMGVRPKRYKQDENKFHWDSYAENAFGRKIPLKKPDHPTIWKTRLMEETGVNPDDIGLQNPQQGEEWLRKWRQQNAQ